MHVGLTFDLRESYPSQDGAPADYFAEYDSEETIQALQEALERIGHHTQRIGNTADLIQFIVEGRTVDLIFNIAEGVGGRSREAQVPALLEAIQIPYTFSDPLTLALCLDKAMTKRLWQYYKLPTLAFWVVSDITELDEICETLPDFPLFVKPLHEGSSKGISLDSLVNSAHELTVSVERVMTMYQQPALIERFLPGREFTAGILGQGREAEVLGVLEITEIETAKVSGFVEKEEWQILYPDTFQPVGPGSLRDELSDIALRAYRAVDCRDAGRVDIRLDGEGTPYLLEINPLPGIHPTRSALPVIGSQAGLSFEELIERILDHAVCRLSLERDWQPGSAPPPKL
jgi:D-alanine-D-alanine ligase